MKLPEGSRGYVARKPPTLAPCAEEGMPFHKIVVPTTDTISALFASRPQPHQIPATAADPSGLRVANRWSMVIHFLIFQLTTHINTQDSSGFSTVEYVECLHIRISWSTAISWSNVVAFCFASCCFLFNFLCRHVGNMFILKQLNAKHFHSLLVGCTGTGKTIAVQEAFGSQHDVQTQLRNPCRHSWEKCVAHCILQHEESQGKWPSDDFSYWTWWLSIAMFDDQRVKFSLLLKSRRIRRFRALKILRGHLWPSTCLLWPLQAGLGW